MKVPPKRKGNALVAIWIGFLSVGLNESPSEKEGKLVLQLLRAAVLLASMKVPPKRKGNPVIERHISNQAASMKVPPKRKGNMTT